MSDKQKQLTKRLLIEGSVVLVMLAVTFALSTLAGSLLEKKIAEKNRIQGQLRTHQSEYTKTNQVLEKATASLKRYQEIIDHSKGSGLALNHNEAKALTVTLQNRYRLHSLQVTLSRIDEITDESFKRENASVVGSLVVMKFEGMSDRHLLSFLQAVKQEFPGYVRYTKVALTRIQPLNTEVLMGISQGGTPALVSGEATFRWLGLKYATEKDDKKKGKAARGAE